ncbi:glycoside hydrolase family 99-like domain-containing protein [Rhodanobacter denitrificans]|uniref:glycoside hydrolase family 99-like domain-containing protein n=1 Tax=Rhodanobacter denitrificans TaxID=666685 RepID=UPI001670494A|nr:glycoside hydrolase family 99-like domain-containing protein [Rhodanobacter denitrificans]
MSRSLHAERLVRAVRALRTAEDAVPVIEPESQQWVDEHDAQNASLGEGAPVARRLENSHAMMRSIGYETQDVLALPMHGWAAKVMAFYLPQFHAIPENDNWWGKGFTEWTNVTRAVPQYEGQYQPHLPGELGFYDLRNGDVLRRQAELARAHGVHGFCFYFYWFAGHRLLEDPLLIFLNDKSIDLTFSLCWANENWTRRWDGHDHDILIGQEHSPEDDFAFIDYVARYMRDPRYLRVDGKPLLTVYRPSLLPNALETADRWRVRCRENGIGEIYLAFTLSFDSFEPREIGFDGAIEFPPNNTSPPNITQAALLLNSNYSGAIYDWRCYVERSKSYSDPGYDIFRGVCPSWDNEARKPGRGTSLRHASPRGYEDWLSNAVRETVRRVKDEDKKLVFVNAWNEWAEGAHLEPDARLGYAYLNSTTRALRRAAEDDCMSRRPDRVAVVVHVFYPELLPEIVDFLNQWEVPARLIATTVHDKRETVQQLLSGLKMPFEVREFENRGRDILPFLKVANELISEGEQLVLKLHTKKSLHRQDGDVWRRDLLSKLAAPERAEHALGMFNRDPSLAVMAPAGHILSMDTYWGSNADSVHYLCRRMGVKGPDHEMAAFPAGSMFYVRLDSIRPLLDCHLDECEFEPESGQLDGTLPHAIERVFGVLAVSNGARMLSTDHDESGQLVGSREYAYAQAAKN